MKGLNFPYYIAKRITLRGERRFSRLIVRVAVTTVAVGVAAMILAVAVLNGFKQEVSGKQRGFFGDITVAHVGTFDEWEQQPITLDPARYQSLVALEGVNEIRRFATKPGIINVNGEVEGVVLKGIDKDYDQSFLTAQLTEGSALDFSDSTAANTQVLISTYTANRLQLASGDSFIMYFVQEQIRPRKFTIRGVFNTGARELDETYIIGALPLIARLNDWTAVDAGGYELRVDDFTKVGEVTDAVQSHLPIGQVALNLRERFPEIFQWLDLLDANPQVILALMMIVAIINMISAMLIIILEKTQLIGVLKALGLPDRGLRQVFLYHAAYLVGLGLVIGNVIALSLYFIQRWTQFIKLDEASYYVAYVPVDISWTEVAALNVGVVVIAILVLLLPAQLIARIDPIRSIQFR